jgi:transcription initiation factor TFIIIB Brf1 subunit/transcription initiation factor TFIIB
MNDIETTKQYCQDNCILSGCNPRVINAALIYLKNYKTYNHQTQCEISAEHKISSVALRNNVHKIQRSEHLDIVKQLLGNPKIGLRC